TIRTGVLDVASLSRATASFGLSTGRARNARTTAPTTRASAATRTRNGAHAAPRDGVVTAATRVRNSEMPATNTFPAVKSSHIAMPVRSRVNPDGEGTNSAKI